MYYEKRIHENKAVNMRNKVIGDIEVIIPNCFVLISFNIKKNVEYTRSKGLIGRDGLYKKSPWKIRSFFEHPKIM